MLPLLSLALLAPGADPVPFPDQPLNTWVKRSPLADAPRSPNLGYEGSLVWDPKNRRVIRWAGHNQGGGGEQNSETWAFDPSTAKWELREPNTSPPGACCNNQNLFDPDQGRFVRFPAFSGSHGWHWFRENYLSNSTVWNYDLATNTWRDRRPAPAPRVAPLRCASWDSDFQVAVVFGGEGSREGTVVYDPYTNTWHRMKPKDEPDPRSGGNMAYDPVNKLHVMFGTQTDNDRATWAYDLRKNTWTAHKPDPSPPTDRNDPVLAYDHASKRVLAVVRVIDKQGKDEVTAAHLETWAFDAGRFTWERVKVEREAEGWGNRARVMVAVPELNALLLESVVHSPQMGMVKGREQQIWTLRTGEAKPGLGPPTPQNVRVHGGAGTVVVGWDAVPGVDRYRVYRGIADTPWAADITAITKAGVTETRYGDGKAPRGKPVYYRVTAVKGDTESELSPVVRMQPRVADDVRASVANPKEVRLAWKPVADAVGYHVERAPVEVFTEDQLVRLKTDTPPLADPSVGAVKAIGKFERVTKDPLKAAAFTDDRIDLTKPTKVEGEATYTHRFAKEQIDPNGKPYRFGVYAYRVVAVNALGVEGGPSAWVLTIPPAVENVYAKEDGTKCLLKWAEPEGGVKGYRVYRMDGPKINGAGQKVVRLTADPTGEAKYTDETGKTDTKRYWVVAMDKLGQEGFPSAPAWGWRQFRKEYAPFTGEWHQ